MNYRKKNIGELENKKQESLRSLDLILEDFGGLLLNRTGGEDFPAEEAGEFRRLRQEIGDSESLIKTIEADTLRIRELDEAINSREREQAVRSRELSGLYIALGKRVLEGSPSGDFAVMDRQRADALIVKIESLESRLEELKAGEGANVFAWIGKSAQGAAARSSLAKARHKLDRLYREAGEQFALPGAQGSLLQGELAGLAGEIEKARSLSQTLAGELAELGGERRKLGGAFGVEGGPARQIQGLERHIGSIRQELKAVYRRFGEQAADGDHKKRFAALFYADDKQVLDKITLIRKTIADYDQEIEKQKASLAVDAELAAIEKFKSAVEDQRDRIAAAEARIAELEGRMCEAKEHIKELEKLL
jgi:chromosome segregation ATPase